MKEGTFFESRWYYLPKGNRLPEKEFKKEAEKLGNVLSNIGMENWLNGDTEDPADISKYEFQCYYV